MKSNPLILSTLSLIISCDDRSEDFHNPCSGQDELSFQLAEQEFTAAEFLEHTDGIDVPCEELCLARTGIDSLESPKFESFLLDWYVDKPPESPSDPVIGTISFSGTYEFCTGGRRPTGHEECPPTGSNLGAYFAQCAYLEPASVIAFIELADQLRTLGVPRKWVQRCLSAAQDEILHAKLLHRLALAEGASVPRPQQENRPLDLFDIALHNAVEGCVTETWAALVARYQSLHAADPRLRAIYTRIADDEARHAQQSWDLHAWFISQLSAVERKRILTAQRSAIDELTATEMKTPPFHAKTGLPSAEQATILAEEFGLKLAA